MYSRCAQHRLLSRRVAELNCLCCERSDRADTASTRKAECAHLADGSADIE